MGRRGMPGRRRQVLQLDENTKTSYLTQTGCYRPDDMFIKSRNAVKTGLALVGEYSDSESDSENEDEQTMDPDVESKLNGDSVMKEEDGEVVKEKTDNNSLQAEMLEIVGAKKETSADIFLREFQAYQKESAAPVYNREFIAFQKESKETADSVSSPSSSLKDLQKEITPKSSEDASLVTKTDTTASNKPKTPDIDSQVASFLAEIDALGDEEEKEKSEELNEIDASDNSGVDREQNVQSNTVSSEPKNKEPLNGNGTSKTCKTVKEAVDERVAAAVQQPALPSQEEKIVWPEEPTTEWQQCYDDNTQHCYYWNITTNEVTWEIPPEFTQYLLLYKEYEEKMTKLLKDGKTKPKKRKIPKKSEKIKKKSSVSETSSKDVESHVEYGPHLPPSVSDRNTKDTGNSPETTEPDHVGQESTNEPAEPMYGPMLKPDSPPEANKEKDEESDAGSISSSTSKGIQNTVEVNEEKDNDTIDDNKIPPVALTALDAGSPVDSAVTVSSHKENSTETSLTANLALMELCKRKFKARISREEESGKSSVSSSVDVKIKDPTIRSDVEEGILDIDEVDRELELALERKKSELKSLEEEEEKQSHEKVRVKRKHQNERGASDDSAADEVSPEKSSKKSKEHRESSLKHSKKTKHKKDDANGISSDESSLPRTTSKKSRSSDQKKSRRSHQSKKESRPKKSKAPGSSKERVDSKSRSSEEAEEKFKESVIDLSLLVMDKMDFLEIDVSKQSKLQHLYIQLKTRISDWHAGGLSTKYFYVKLQEANQQLGQYEKSGAPTGWSINWDRTCKRYFYTNNTTGHSQWEYPDPQSKGEGAELPDTLGAMAGSLALPLLLPPPPPPPSPPSSSPSSEAAKTQVTSVVVTEEKEHQKVSKGSERSERSSKKESHSSSKSEGRKDKRSRKESKSSKSSRNKDSSRSKSHSESSSNSKLKDFVCELSIYPGEPPPPGTELHLQPSATTDLSSISIGRSKSPKLSNTSSLKKSCSVEDDLMDVMKLADSLSRPTTSAVSDDMEIDPDDEVSNPTALLPSSELKINSTSVGSNGTMLSIPDDVGSHVMANSFAVISKPPQILARPAQCVETIASGCESTLSSSGQIEATVNDPSSISLMPELHNESSNSPKPIDNNETTETKNPKEKRKKKDKVITGTSLTLKKKNVSSLVEKWQKVKKEVEKEDELARHEFCDGD